MKPAAFDYYRPATVAETVGLLAELREDAAVLAGGMTLGPMLNLRMVRPRAVIDISRMDALRTISVGGNVLATGSAVVQGDALQSEAVRREGRSRCLSSDISKPATAARSAARWRMPIRAPRFRSASW